MVRARTMRGMFLTNKIYHAHPNGFCGAIVSGARGIGKSSFALNVLWELFRLLGYEEKEAWIEALKYCKFSMEDVINLIEQNILSENKAYCVLWDDAGVYASTMEWWANRDQLRRLKGVLDTIRTGVCSLILTTPNESDLTKIVRNYDDYIVQIRYHESGGNYRYARGYLKRTLPSGKIMIYPKFRNPFLVRLPDWVFAKYMEMREKILIEQIDEIKKMLKEDETKDRMKKISDTLRLVKLKETLSGMKKTSDENIEDNV